MPIIDCFLLTHEIDLVVKRLCHLKDRMDEECIVQFVWARAIEAQHLLTQRLLHVSWEVVEQTQQVLKANEFTEVGRGHHDFCQ